MRGKNKILYFYLVIILFIVTPFTLSYTDTDNAEILNAVVLPPFIASLSSIIRWFIIGIMALNALFIMNKNIKNISKPILFLALFYGVQLVYALVDGFDVGRFFLMSALSILIPLHLSISFKYFGKKLINIFTYCIFAFIIFSLLLNGNLALAGQRFFGFINNSNLYAMTAVFWAVIFVLKLKQDKGKKNLAVNIFLILLILTIILSGSRNGLIGIILVLALSFYNKIKNVIGFLLIFSVAFLILNNFVNLSFVEERLFNISNSVKDSGRDEIWRTAYIAISQNLYTGNGMNANIVISETGNMHNSYIRFVLNMGLVFTILSLLQYLISLYYIFLNRSKIQLVILAFLIAYTLANFGEDYFVGLGSSMFIYVLMIYGLVNYYIKFKTNRSTITEL